MVLSHIKFRYSICLPLLIALFLLSYKACADTPFTDISIELGVEIGNEEIDFKDAGATVEKGRFIAYRIFVKNNGTGTHENLTLLFDTPDYMTYVPATAYKQSGTSAEATPIFDVNGISALETGYEIESLGAGESVYFTIQFQVTVPATVKDDQLYTAAWANIWGEYSSMPRMSGIVENTISGEAKPAIQVKLEANPPVGEKVNSGFQIAYNYTLHNVGGISAAGVTFTTYLPEFTTCLGGCGVISIGNIAPNEEIIVTMLVMVNNNLAGVTEITNIGYDMGGANIEAAENRDTVIHPIDLLANAEGDFIIGILQVPNIVLNSADSNPRADLADLTETQYTMYYKGKQKPYTWPILSTFESTTIENEDCGTYTYPQAWGAYTYAYNSYGGGCDNIFGCPPSSSPIVFNVATILPDNAPDLDFTINTPAYSFGTPEEVNSFMKNGGIIQIPGIFTQSRAIGNGAFGVVSSEITATVPEDYYQYVRVGEELWCYGDCEGEDCEPPPIYRPVYQWIETTPSSILLKDSDNTFIDVYTSTAWLKTEGGHIGTNDSLTNGEQTPANYVDLLYDSENPYARINEQVKIGHLTPSSLYTPPGEVNAEYMIFGNGGTGEMKTSCGKEDGGACDDWLVTGTEFPFLQKGEDYDRETNPRDYYGDMLDREKYGEVRKNELPSALTGTVDLGDNIIWSNTGDIVIGEEGADDTVVFAGGQSRIYTEGDVYINANILYSVLQAYKYNDITSVRIDARNIYVAGEVTDLEVMLLARENFYSGVSNNQLRILGDVIAGKTNWERAPLLEYSPTEFNKPSEYIIEDMRKYVVPAPGDTEIPDDYTIWRQVNPSTGEVLDGY
jgi:hypothetical protein